MFLKSDAGGKICQNSMVAMSQHGEDCIDGVLMAHG